MSPSSAQNVARSATDGSLPSVGSFITTPGQRIIFLSIMGGVLFTCVAMAIVLIYFVCRHLPSTNQYPINKPFTTYTQTSSSSSPPLSPTQLHPNIFEMYHYPFSPSPRIDSWPPHISLHIPSQVFHFDDALQDYKVFIPPAKGKDSPLLALAGDGTLRPEKPKLGRKRDTIRSWRASRRQDEAGLASSGAAMGDAGDCDDGDGDGDVSGLQSGNKHFVKRNVVDPGLVAPHGFI